MVNKSPERKIYDVLLRATNEGAVPFVAITGPPLVAGQHNRKCNASILEPVPLCIWTQTAKSIAISPRLRPSLCALSTAPRTELYYHGSKSEIQPTGR
jgi:hypothetical protein